jgi:hypothetical protein
MIYYINIANKDNNDNHRNNFNNNKILDDVNQKNRILYGLSSNETDIKKK